jgi:Tol biopolymer transport system component
LDAIMALVTRLSKGIGSDIGGISADGRFVVFSSTATDLDHGQVDSNAATDVFLFDRLTQTTTLVSHIPGAPGTTGNGASSNPVISADGAYVAFRSAATNLVPGTGDRRQSASPMILRSGSTNGQRGR